jgi:hypothetical protein
MTEQHESIPGTPVSQELVEVAGRVAARYSDLLAGLDASEDEFPLPRTGEVNNMQQEKQ